MYRTIITCDICRKEQEDGAARYEVRVYHNGSGNLRFDVCSSCYATSIKSIFVVNGNEWD